ncbi:putative peptidase YuxL [Ktedonobacteria bacterium brp13]|nr:putative peptidase YuxL [Ktedonobacteria bacterium brp13]
MSTLENEEPTTQRAPVQTNTGSTVQPDLDNHAPGTPIANITPPDTNPQNQPTITIQPPPEAASPSLQPVLPPMDIDNLLTLKIVSDPQISPDGRYITYTLLTSSAESNTTTSAIWLVDICEGKTIMPRQLSSGMQRDTQPRWSPDGQTLAFLSDRTGEPQIYLLSLLGGEARRISNLTHGVSEYSWHPAGQMLLAHSAWKPQDDQPDQPGTAASTTIYTRLDARHDGSGERNGRHQQLWLVPLTGETLRLTSEPVDLVQSCWSPDGQEVVFSANRRADPDLSVSMALWVLTLATGKLRRLTPEEGLAQMPAWSPDGQHIAYLYSPDQTEASHITPWIVNAQGESTPHLAVPGAEAYTSQAWIIDELRDEYLARPLWYPHSQALLLPFQQRGQLHLYRLDLTQQNLQRLTTGNGRYISPQLSQNGKMIAMVRADWFTPGDIWCMDSQSLQPRKLTRINDPILQSHRLTRPRRINWQSFDGKQIEGVLYLPILTTGQKAPLVLAIHGGPSLAWGDSYVHEFQVLTGRGIAVLAPNPRGSAGYGEDFSRSVLNDWGGADLKDLLTGIDYVIANEPIDPQRLGIGGMSYGGYMTNWAISQDPRFKAAVSRNGISSIESATLLTDQTVWFALSMDETTNPQQRSALNFVDKVQTPLLLLHGEKDLRCPFSESYQFFIALRKRKKPVELVNYLGASHLMDWPGINEPQQRVDRLRRTVQWFERFLIHEISSQD